MTVKFSTGLRDILNGYEATIKGAVIGAGLTFVDGGPGLADTITDSGTGFVTAGFAPGDVLFVQGCTTPANVTGLSGERIVGVAAGTLTMATALVDTGEIGAVGTVVACCKGGSLKDAMKDGKLMIYTGSPPSDPDDGVGTATLLVTITESAGTFVAGAFGNGLEFENDPTDGVIEKASGETWQGAAVASGVAGFFIFVGNATDALGSSTTLPRIVGSVGLSGADLVIGSTNIVSGRTYTIDEFTLTLPMYYGA
jgi:hypothetical protein